MLFLKLIILTPTLLVVGRGAFVEDVNDECPVEDETSCLIQRSLRPVSAPPLAPITIDHLSRELVPAKSTDQQTINAGALVFDSGLQYFFSVWVNAFLTGLETTPFPKGVNIKLSDVRAPPGNYTTIVPRTRLDILVPGVEGNIVANYTLPGHRSGELRAKLTPDSALGVSVTFSTTPDGKPQVQASANETVAKVSDVSVSESDKSVEEWLKIKLEETLTWLLRDRIELLFNEKVNKQLANIPTIMPLFSAIPTTATYFFDMSFIQINIEDLWLHSFQVGNVTTDSVKPYQVRPLHIHRAPATQDKMLTFYTTEWTANQGLFSAFEKGDLVYRTKLNVSKMPRGVMPKHILNSFQMVAHREGLTDWGDDFTLEVRARSAPTADFTPKGIDVDVPATLRVFIGKFVSNAFQADFTLQLIPSIEDRTSTGEGECLVSDVKLISTKGVRAVGSPFQNILKPIMKPILGLLSPPGEQPHWRFFVATISNPASNDTFYLKNSSTTLTETEFQIASNFVVKLDAQGR